jgi:hypothetical protein
MIEMGYIYLYGFAAIIFALASWLGERADRRGREIAERVRRERLHKALPKILADFKDITRP